MMSDAPESWVRRGASIGPRASAQDVWDLGKLLLGRSTQQRVANVDGVRSAAAKPPSRVAAHGGSPREGARSEARAEQRPAAGGAAPPTRISTQPASASPTWTTQQHARAPRPNALRERT